MIIRKFFVILMTLILGLLSCQSNHEVKKSSNHAKQIYLDMGKLHGKQKINSLSKNDYLNLINSFPEKDTICILESWDYEAFYRCVGWNGTDTIWGINGVFYSNKYLRFGKPMFPIYMMNLIWGWDVMSIRLEEEVNPPPYMNRDVVFATRIIFREGQYQIETIHFLEFYKKGRDGVYPR